MGFKCGIIGLPNVGKSTLFNALTQTAAAEAMNYPFCTVEPNIGKIGVQDPRLYKLASIAESAKVIPTQLEIVDIAGLVRGASKGEGLGNQFLGHIRETDAILHMVRCFDDDNITHVYEHVDPIRDINVVETEMMLADLEILKRRESTLGKKNDSKLIAEKNLLQKTISWLEEGQLIRKLSISEEEKTIIGQWNLLTDKPTLYICNVEESNVVNGNSFSDKVRQLAQQSGSSIVIVSAAIEAEIAQISDAEEKAEYLHALGLQESGLTRVAQGGYDLLNLLTFFTVGKVEAHAWTTIRGATAPMAAGVIHTDFQRGFICAETISYEDYVCYNGEGGAKTAGKMRLEGKDYKVQDGDIFHFRFNV